MLGEDNNLQFIIFEDNEYPTHYTKYIFMTSEYEFKVSVIRERKNGKFHYFIKLYTEGPAYAPDIFFSKFIDELENARLTWNAHVEERNSAYALARAGRTKAGPQQALDIFAMHQFGSSARAANPDAIVSGEMEPRDYARMYSEALPNHSIFEGGRIRRS